MVQVPDFGDRFYVYAMYDQRTDEIGRIGKQYGTKPGFYMIAGPRWNGELPKGITAVVRSSTDLCLLSRASSRMRHLKIPKQFSRSSIRS